MERLQMYQTIGQWAVPSTGMRKSWCSRGECRRRRLMTNSLQQLYISMLWACYAKKKPQSIQPRLQCYLLIPRFSSIMNVMCLEVL